MYIRDLTIILVTRLSRFQFTRLNSLFLFPTDDGGHGMNQDGEWAFVFHIITIPRDGRVPVQFYDVPRCFPWHSAGIRPVHVGTVAEKSRIENAGASVARRIRISIYHEPLAIRTTFPLWSTIVIKCGGSEKVIWNVGCAAYRHWDRSREITNYLDTSSYPLAHVPRSHDTKSSEWFNHW